DADVRDVDTGGNASHSKAEEAPARSTPSEGIFKVKASQAAEPTPDDGILPSNSRLSIGELAPTAVSAVENNTLRTTPQGRRKATDVAMNQGSENTYQGSSVESEDLSLGDEEDLDLDWPEAEEKVKSRQEAKHVTSSAKTKPGSRHGQDATIEIQEASQSATPDPVRTEDLSARAFEETEHRLREDIESLRKLEEELQLRGPKGTSQPKQTKAQKAEGSAASHKRRKGPAAAAVQQAVSLLEIGSAPASVEELQTLQIEQLAAGQREVAMKAAQEVADSSASPMTAEQLDRTRRAALQSVEHAVAEQVNAQERQQTAKAVGAMSELFAGVQSDRKAIASKMVKRLQADLTETKEQAQKDHQVEEQKVSVLLERLDHLRSQPEHSNEDKLLISRARQILELKAQVQWDNQRLSKEKEDELALKVQIKQLEEKLRRQRHASLREAARRKPFHNRASARRIAVDVDHSGRTLSVERADPY
ncbi:ACP5, partial [Symbiodinium necroappetens]